MLHHRSWPLHRSTLRWPSPAPVTTADSRLWLIHRRWQTCGTHQSQHTSVFYPCSFLPSCTTTFCYLPPVPRPPVPLHSLWLITWTVYKCPLAECHLNMQKSLFFVVENHSEPGFKTRTPQHAINHNFFERSHFRFDCIMPFCEKCCHPSPSSVSFLCDTVLCASLNPTWSKHLCRRVKKWIWLYFI